MRCKVRITASETLLNSAVKLLMQEPSERCSAGSDDGEQLPVTSRDQQHKEADGSVEEPAEKETETGGSGKERFKNRGHAGRPDTRFRD